MFATPVNDSVGGSALVTAPRLSDMGVSFSSAKRPRLEVREVSFEEVRDAAYRWRGRKKGDDGSTESRDTQVNNILTKLLERESVLLKKLGVAEGEVRELRVYSSRLAAALGDSIRAHQALDSAIVAEEASGGVHSNDTCPFRPQLEEVTSAVSEGAPLRAPPHLLLSYPTPLHLHPPTHPNLHRPFNFISVFGRKTK